jgi:hypothetical protein
MIAHRNFGIRKEKMMIRICTFVCGMLCSNWVAIAGEPIAENTLPKLVVVFDRETAALLTPVPPGVVLRTLIHEKSDSYEAINARALAMRSANFFVYHGGHESSLAAMYRERLQMQGVVAIDVRSVVKRQKRIDDSTATPQHVSLLTTISNQPQTTKEGTLK